MKKTFPIADAKNRLSQLVHQVEQGDAVELTRRGKPVAMLLSAAHYQQLTAPRKSVWTAIAAWRSRIRTDNADDELTDEEVAGWRDRSLGREFSWED